MRPIFWPVGVRGTGRGAAIAGRPAGARSSPGIAPRPSCAWAHAVIVGNSIGASRTTCTLNNRSTTAPFTRSTMSWKRSNASFLYSVRGSRCPYPRSPMPSFR